MFIPHVILIAILAIGFLVSYVFAIDVARDNQASDFFGRLVCRAVGLCFAGIFASGAAIYIEMWTAV